MGGWLGQRQTSNSAGRRMDARGANRSRQAVEDGGCRFLGWQQRWTVRAPRQWEQQGRGRPSKWRRARNSQSRCKSSSPCCGACDLAARWRHSLSLPPVAKMEQTMPAVQLARKQPHLQAPCCPHKQQRWRQSRCATLMLPMWAGRPACWDCKLPPRCAAAWPVQAGRFSSPGSQALPGGRCCHRCRTGAAGRVLPARPHPGHRMPCTLLRGRLPGPQQCSRLWRQVLLPLSGGSRRSMHRRGRATLAGLAGTISSSSSSSTSTSTTTGSRAMDGIHSRSRQRGLSSSGRDSSMAREHMGRTGRALPGHTPPPTAAGIELACSEGCACFLCCDLLWCDTNESTVLGQWGRGATRGAQVVVQGRVYTPGGTGTHTLVEEGRAAQVSALATWA